MMKHFVLQIQPTRNPIFLILNIAVQLTSLTGEFVMHLGTKVSATIPQHPNTHNPQQVQQMRDHQH